MAIAFDSASGATTIVSGTTRVLSHTCTGSNLILIVSVYFNTELGSDTVSVDYNGTAMTKINSQLLSNGVDGSLWILVNPATGTHNITVTCTGSHPLGLCAASYTGCSQVGQPDAQNSGQAMSAASVTVNLTTVADNCWTILAAVNGTTMVAGIGSTNTRVSGATGNGRQALFDAGPITPAGSYSMTCDGDSGQNYIGLMISIKPPAIVNSNFLTFM